MSKIIVSYRRNDTQAIAGRIRDRLAAEYGADCVFMDIDSIPLGRDFRAHIKESMAGSDVLVAIIGPKWLGEKRGKRARIDNPNDPVRVEIETALQLNLDIVPVLVDDAVMPAAADLPASIQEFSYLHAATIDDGLDFHQHMNRLIRGLDELNPRKPVATLARKK